jgi:DHA1 family bicyclomycin/chloramphenicol resistance-like MFS transporter
MQNQSSGHKPHIVAIMLIASLGPVNLTILSPSLAAIAHELDAPYAQVQLLLSGYMALTAVLQLAIGPLSDRFGRRPVLLGSLAIFLAGTLVCIFATSISVLLAGRMVQATAIGGLVLSRAIVSDTVPPVKAASILSYISMGMTLGPMLAPVGGGFLASLYGWHSSFVVILVFGAIVTLTSILTLSETHHQPVRSMAAQVRSWPYLLTNRRFWGYTLAATFGSGAYFTFLGGAPYVGFTLLHVSQSELGYLFAFVSIGYVGGSFVSGRFAQAWGPIAMMMAGSLTVLAACLLPILLFQAGQGGPASFFIPMMLMGFGNGMALPSANAGAVSARPDLAGSASGLSGAVNIGGGALLSISGGFVLSPTSGPTPLLLVMALSALLCFLATLYVRRLDRIEGDDGERQMA